MTEKEAKGLTLGAIVRWDGDPNDLGTVTRMDVCGFYVEWDAQVEWIDYQDAEKIICLV